MKCSILLLGVLLAAGCGGTDIETSAVEGSGAAAIYTGGWSGAGDAGGAGGQPQQSDVESTIQGVNGLAKQGANQKTNVVNAAR
jgi:hypothetical protein